MGNFQPGFALEILENFFQGLVCLVENLLVSPPRNT